MKDIWVPISSAIAQQRKVETIAHNVANANTTGFKRDQLVFKEYLTAFEKGVPANLPEKEWMPEDFYRSYGAENAHVKIDGSYTIHEQGQLSPTNNPLDLAIRGPGFFEVLTPNGIRYTRSGVFSISSDGKLVTDQGYHLLSKMGLGGGPGQQNQLGALPPPEQRTITLGRGSISVNLQGEIFASGNNKIGDISVTEFNNIHALQKEGNSLYVNSEFNNISTKELKSSIHQGFLEQSNVNAVSEMAALIQAHRHFDNIQRAIKTYDSISGKSINEISNF